TFALPRLEKAEVELVADRMNQNLRDQLIAGVPRPSVELEVHFEWDSAEIHDQSSPEIRAAAELLNRHFPVTRFRLVGFTDQSGDADYNQLLSERRASAVWRALVEDHGVAAERLARIGFGERDPAGDSSDAQRRRVELQIVRGDAQPF
ncbi:MAG: OmpA family protein, partial [Myxococcota bacterium]